MGEGHTFVFKRGDTPPRTHLHAMTFFFLLVLTSLLTVGNSFPSSFTGSVTASTTASDKDFGNMGIAKFAQYTAGKCVIIHDIPLEGYTTGSSYTFTITTDVQGGLGMVYKIGADAQANTGGGSDNPRKITTAATWVATSTDNILAHAICGAGGDVDEMHVATIVQVKNVVPQTCANGKIALSTTCQGSSADASGTPSCAGNPCTGNEFADENTVCCTLPQTCAHAKANSGMSCGGGSVDAVGSPSCQGAACTTAEFANLDGVCCRAPACVGYTFAAGIEAGTSSPCTSGTALAAGTACNVKCGADYVDQGELTITCAGSASEGDLTDVSPAACVALQKCSDDQSSSSCISPAVIESVANCAGAACETIDFGDETTACCALPQTCAHAKATSGMSCDGGSVDAVGAPSCSGLKCDASEFANAAATCCSAPQTCADAKTNNAMSCGDGSVDAPGTPSCAGLVCIASEFDDAQGGCCATPNFCALGEFTTLQNLCESCPIGWNGVVDDTIKICQRCPPGKFSNTSASTSCYECIPGTSQRGVAARSCRKCNGGKYASAPASYFCDKCEPGKVTDNTGTAVCPFCPLGKYQDEFSQRFCKACPTGYHGLDHHKTCLGCPKGKFGTGENMENITKCKACETGRYTALIATFSPVGGVSGSIPCIACPKGRWSSVIGLTQEVGCVFCSSGYYNEVEAASDLNSCISCAPGKFNENFGSTKRSECISCPAGYNQADRGSGSCSPCPPGTVAPNSQTVQCTLCAPGRFQSSLASQASGCEIAPPGYYASSGGHGVQPVADGWRATECTHSNDQHDAKGCTEAMSCPPGKYGASPAGGVCFECPAGWYSKIALISCVSCSPGLYQQQVSQGSCKNCPSGFIQELPKGVGCRACSTGTFAGIAGLDECEDCKPGQYQNYTGTSGCVSCPAGWVQERNKAFECKQCVRGQHTAAETGSAQCWYVPEDPTVAPPMLDSLLSVDRDVSKVRLSLRVHFDNVFDPRVEHLVVRCHHAFFFLVSYRFVYLCSVQFEMAHV